MSSGLSPARFSSSATSPFVRRVISTDMSALLRSTGPVVTSATSPRPAVDHPAICFPHIRRDKAGTTHGVFLFFSNRLGCLGSLIVSAAVTLLLLLILGVIHL